MGAFQMDATAMEQTFGALFKLMKVDAVTIIAMVAMVIGLTTVARRRIVWLQDWKILFAPLVIGVALGYIYPVFENTNSNLRFGLQIGVMALAVYQLGFAQLGKLATTLKPLVGELTTKLKNGNGESEVENNET